MVLFSDYLYVPKKRNKNVSDFSFSLDEKLYGANLPFFKNCLVYFMLYEYDVYSHLQVR